MNTQKKMIVLIAFSVLLLVSCRSIEQVQQTSQPTNQFSPLTNSSDDTHWQYVPSLSDEFNESSVDTQKWDNDLNDWGPWSWEPENVYQQNGNLNISLNYEPHTAKRHAYKGNRKKIDVDLFYKSGIIRSLAYQTYGYYEARVKGIQTFPGSSPAFWIYSNSISNKKEGFISRKEGDVTYSEVDIVELQQHEWIKGTRGEHDGPDVIDMNLHTRIIENGKETWKRPGKYPALTKNKVHVDFDSRDDFHVYGAEVAKDIVTWYIDGVKVAEKPNKHWHLPMHVTLSLGLRHPHVSYRCEQALVRCPVADEATAEGYPSAMEVDWVRVYKKR